MKPCILLFITLFTGSSLPAQSDQTLVEKTLHRYIEGSSYNRLDVLESTFITDATLYLTIQDEFKRLSPKEPMRFFEDNQCGQFNGRTGHVLNAYVQKKILMVTSNQHYYGDTKINAANHFSEIVLAYDVFVNNGYGVDIISPEGGAIPIGYLNTSNPVEKKYLYDGDFMNKLEHTLKPSEVRSADYAAIYYSGGGAAMFGIADNELIHKLAVNIYEDDGVVSAVCHGTAGIVNLKAKNGQPIFKGKKITGFPDSFESKDKPYYATFPFKIDDAVNNKDGKFKYSKKGWDNYYIKDGRLITGQDPSSVTSVAEEVVAYIESANQAPAQKVSEATGQQSELEQIKAVCMDYIEGTANGQPDRVRHAFHEDLNLYFVKNDSLQVWNGQEYIGNIKEGEKNTRQGKIVSIDYENDAAMAKIEILVPEWRVFTDYLMLLKIAGRWKIIHKSFTYKAIESDNK